MTNFAFQRSGYSHECFALQSCDAKFHNGYLILLQQLTVWLKHTDARTILKVAMTFSRVPLNTGEKSQSVLVWQRTGDTTELLSTVQSVCVCLWGKPEAGDSFKKVRGGWQVNRRQQSLDDTMLRAQLCYLASSSRDIWSVWGLTNTSNKAKQRKTLGLWSTFVCDPPWKKRDHSTDALATLLKTNECLLLIQCVDVVNRI